MLQDLETARKFVRPSIYAYTKATEQLRALARQTFEDISAGVLKPTIHAQLSLSEAPELHSIIESRASIGSSVMLCD
jgi:NADPH:quinone reductase-like Zn-dependent oxidoreductase